MRNPKRIKPFLETIEKCWMKVPDWRFGQLMLNVLGEMAGTGRDPFFPEEKEMEEFFIKFFKEDNQPVND